MKVQILSNLWSYMPPKFVRTAPTLILSGNIGRLCGERSVETINLVNQLSNGFTNVLWIPHVAETFMGNGKAFEVQTMRNLVHTFTDARLLCNDVVTVGDTTLVATSGWRQGVGGAPDTTQTCWWQAEDQEFIAENASVDTVLISAGAMYYWKPKTVIIGSPPAGFENMTAISNKQCIYSNSANHKGFCSAAQFELH
jgi:hypothetical protein